MGLFSKPEVIILKDSSSANDELKKLEEFLASANDKTKPKIQNEIRNVKKGIEGENEILYELKNSGLDLVVLHDLCIETKDGRKAQIDFLVISKRVIFVIECKDLYGNIEIDSKGNFIRIKEYNGSKHKTGMYSPIEQNKKHIEIMKERLAEEKGTIMSMLVKANFDNAYKPLVILANNDTYLNDKYAKKEIKDLVHRSDQLTNIIKKYNSESNEPTMSKEDMLKIGNAWLNRNVEIRIDYSKKYENLINDTSNSQEQSNLCPLCGSPLVIREAKKGNNVGHKFYGCSSFPKCKYTKQVK